MSLKNQLPSIDPNFYEKTKNITAAEKIYYNNRQGMIFIAKSILLIKDQKYGSVDLKINSIIKPDYHFFKDSTGIIIESKASTIFLIDFSKRNEGLGLRKFNISDLISSEIFEDGTSITKTDRSNQILKATIGEMIAGDIGAIIGGLGSSTSTTKNLTSRIALRLVVNDIKSPLHDINFLSEEVYKKSETYKNAMLEARKVYGIIQILINKANIENIENKPVKDSIADELRKLAKLKNDGILTQEEFNKLKQKLLENFL